MVLSDTKSVEKSLSNSSNKNQMTGNVRYASKDSNWFFGWIPSPLPEHQENELGYIAQFEGDENEGYVATIPNLPGCVTEGDSFEEVFAYLQDALAGWLGVAKDKGLNIPEPDSPKLV
jgi:antitoxin HicB